MISLYAAYEEVCERGGLVDFAELLLRAHELWRNNPDLLAHRETLKEGFGEELLVDDFALPRPLDEMPEEFQEERKKAQAEMALLIVLVTEYGPTLRTPRARRTSATASRSGCPLSS